MWKKSLKCRFLLTLILPLCLALAAAGVGSYYSARHEIDEVYDAQLAYTAKTMLALMEHEATESDYSLGELVLRFSNIGHKYEKNIAIRIWLKDALLFSTENAQAFGAQNVIAGFSDKWLDGIHWRMFVIGDPATGMIAEVSEKQLVRRDIIQKIQFSIFLPLLGLLVVLPLLFWLGLRWGLRPLERISQQVSQRSSDDLMPLSTHSVPSEALPLVLAINDLLSKVKRALEVERRFTDLAAHELRTPLAVIKTQAVAAIRATDESTRRQMLVDLSQGIDRASAMVVQLLSLARLGHEHIIKHPLHLNALAAQVMKELAPLSLHKQQKMSFEEEAQVWIQANQDILALLIRNIVDNAIKYTPQEGDIRVRIYKEQHQSVIEVIDSGPGIPEDKLEMVSDRFYRVPGNKESGTGLGLTIVSRAATVLGAKLTLANRTQHSGLIAKLHFPQETHIMKETS